MTRETLTHLNTNTLIGFTEKRGNAWHYRADLQGDEPNHYPGGVPLADVVRRLFHWKADSVPVFVQVPADFDTMTHLNDENLPVRLVQVEGKQAIWRPDTALTMGIFAEGYIVHQYEEWLLQAVSNLLGDTLSIGSAGLLKGGAVAWVSVEVPETITTREGVAFRPNMLACTSCDGSLATTYKPIVTNVVCDNTMATGLGEAGSHIKVKHSRYSKLKLEEARDALGFIENIADDFAEEVKTLCEVTVTDAQWFKFLEEISPVGEDKGRAQTIAINKQDTLTRLWRHDERVSPWKNTAWGVVQAVNTYTHHEGTIRGADRAERNMLRAISGGVDKLDRETIQSLGKVLSNA